MSEQLGEDDDGLRAALRGVPAATPGPAFTARVLARLDRPPRARRALSLRGRSQVPAWVTAAATMAVLAGGLWGVTAGRQAWQQERRRAALRAESAALARELAALHEEVAKPVPVLYLGGNEQVDVVLDLSSLPIAAAAPGAGKR
jgi:hypothetical protein